MSEPCGIAELSEPSTIVKLASTDRKTSADESAAGGNSNSNFDDSPKNPPFSIDVEEKPTQEPDFKVLFVLLCRDVISIIYTIA